MNKKEKIFYTLAVMPVLITLILAFLKGFDVINCNWFIIFVPVILEIIILLMVSVYSGMILSKEDDNYE